MKTTKSILVFAAVMMLAVISNATICTVSNSIAAPGQYATIDLAITASSTLVMDTILVAGSYNYYSPFSVSRRVCIIGTGWNPQKQSPLLSTISGNASFFSSASASGSFIIGLCFINGINSFFTIDEVQNITFKRNKFDGVVNASPGGSGPINGWIIEGNVWTGVQNNYNLNFHTSTLSACIIRNNVFTQAIGGLYAGIHNLLDNPSGDCYILNNVFLSGSSGTGVGSLSLANSGNWNVNNNIFKTNPGTGGNMNVNNNSTTTTSISGAGTGNLTSQTVLFQYPGNVWTAFADFNLTTGSPSIATGNDGTDRGVYGNFIGFYQTYGEPDIPQISKFNITSPTSISPGGTLDINVISKRHQ